MPNNKASQMNNPDYQTQKTGTLKPASKPFPVLDFADRDDKCRSLCAETRQSVVLYHDERGGLSFRTVRDSQTMKLPAYVLAVYRFVQGRVVEKMGIIKVLIECERNFA